MSLLIALIIGGIIGWLAAAVTGRREGIIGSVAIGVIGSIIGVFLASFFNGAQQSYLTFTLPGLVWSFIGAVIFVVILNAIQHRSYHNS